MQAGILHNSVKPLCWLIGKWQSVCAEVFYPSMETVSYCEDLQFTSVGQPLLNYQSNTWNSKTKVPMHFERGFLRIHDDGVQVALLTAQSFGLVTVEKGLMRNKTMMLGVKNSNLIVSKFAKKRVLQLQRTYKLNHKNQLEYTCLMETCDVPLTDHIKVVYEKEKC